MHSAKVFNKVCDLFEKKLVYENILDREFLSKTKHPSDGYDWFSRDGKVHVHLMKSRACIQTTLYYKSLSLNSGTEDEDWWHSKTFKISRRTTETILTAWSNLEFETIKKNLAEAAQVDLLDREAYKKTAYLRSLADAYGLDLRVQRPQQSTEAQISDILFKGEEEEIVSLVLPRENLKAHLKNVLALIEDIEFREELSKD